MPFRERFWGQGQGRVGRRIIATLMTCALIPLIAFAFLSYQRVTAELARNAEVKLKQDVKAVGVTLLERLVVAANELLRQPDPTLSTQTAEYLQRHQAIAERRPAETLLFFDLEARSTVQKTGILLIFDPAAEDPRDGVWIVARQSFQKSPIAGRVDPRFLFNPDGLARPPSEYAIFLPDGRRLAYDGEEGELPPERSDLEAAGVFGKARASFTWSADGDERLGEYWEVFMAPELGTNLIAVAHESRTAVLAPIAAFRRDLLHVVALTILGVLFASLLRVKRITAPVRSLVEATERVAQEDYTTRVAADTDDEFGQPGRAFNAMTAGLGRRAEVIARVNEFGSSLGEVTEPDQLVQRLARTAGLLVRADGILILVADHAGESLELANLRVRSAGIRQVRSEKRVRIEDLPAFEAGQEGAGERALDAWLHATVAGFAPDRKYQPQHVAAFPLRNVDDETIGLLAFLDPEDADGRIVAFDAETRRTARSLASQAAVALANMRLRHEFKALFDAMIEVLAVAVDEKSPYTGGHCRRVPDLAMRIFDAVESARTGPFGGVRFDAAERYEMQVASLLHDCGKVVTPVHVVDKATKLETIFDRIAMIDQRFEIVARDREIAALRERCAAEGVDLEEAESRIDAAVARLREDREFVRGTNKGGESLDDASIARIETLATELAWRDVDGAERPFLDEDERKNLSIRRGTLTAEEREVINYHMTATIRMLDQLPFPKRMRNVCHIAGAHHERMDGRGFPLGLTGDQIMLQGRMLAIADVFEALTANDRPYKPGMPLSQTLAIMSRMTRDAHLDPQLFDLFLESRTWEEYARETLRPEQCDEVDIDSLRSVYRELLTA
ncbi:MAG: HD domain-containing phosphohydrolase [Planctomycetota bacterium]